MEIPDVHIQVPRTIRPWIKNVIFIVFQVEILMSNELDYLNFIDKRDVHEKEMHEKVLKNVEAAQETQKQNY